MPKDVDINQGDLADEKVRRQAHDADESPQDSCQDYTSDRHLEGVQQANQHGAVNRVCSSESNGGLAQVEARRILEEVVADRHFLLGPQGGHHVAVKEQQDTRDQSNYDDLIDDPEKAFVSVERGTRMFCVSHVLCLAKQAMLEE